MSHQFRRVLLGTELWSFNASRLLLLPAIAERPEACIRTEANPRLEGLGGLAFSSQELSSAVTTETARVEEEEILFLLDKSWAARLLQFCVCMVSYIMWVQGIFMFCFWEASQQLAYDLESFQWLSWLGHGMTWARECLASVALTKSLIP